MNRIRKVFSANSNILSNYFHLTVIQAINSFFYLLVYPFVIAKVGVEGYGTYVFAASVSALFSVFVSFGFDLHATKIVAMGEDSGRSYARLFSTVTVSKVFLELVALMFFFLLATFSPYPSLYWACFAGTLASVLLPSWYFHGVQKMHVMTVIQLSVKLVSLPIIVLLVRDSSDIIVYAMLVSGANVLAAAILFYLAIRVYELKFTAPSISEIFDLIRRVQPFFWSTAIVTAKQRGIELSIGLLFGMREVAIYDLANKFFSVGSVLASNVNAAMFPKLSRGASEIGLQKIFKYELLLGVSFVLGIYAFGGYIIDFFFGSEMSQAYELSVILSLNIIAYLLVGCYMLFAFIPWNRYDLILKNQVMAITLFVLLSVIFLQIRWGVSSIILALVGSGLAEILYCGNMYRRIVKENK